MSDIVTKIEKCWNGKTYDPTITELTVSVKVLRDAADEIERLRQKLKALVDADVHEALMQRERDEALKRVKKAEQEATKFINQSAVHMRQRDRLQIERDEARAAARYFCERMNSIDRNVARGWQAAYRWMDGNDES